MKRRDFCKASVIVGTAAALPAKELLAVAYGPIAEIVSDVPAITVSGTETVLEKAALTEFAESLRGVVLVPGHDGYDAARRVWNGMIDKRPAVIARCTGSADISRAVNFARERQLLVAVRGGGHSIPGKSTCDGGLVIDLSPINGVRVDPVARAARVGPGTLGGGMDREAQYYGLATTLGTVSHTGVAGLTLGGGFGWLSRRFGLACDNLISVDIVTADGTLRRVSAEENPDLFWALHGGGGNFGVVSSFEYRLHPVGPQVLAGRLVFPLSEARRIIEFYGEFAATAPRELNVDLGLETPPGGTLGAVIYVCYTGDPAIGEKLMAPLRKLGKPIEDTIGMTEYVKVQTQFDGLPRLPLSVYFKSGFITGFPAGLVDALADGFKPDAAFSSYFMHSGGAVADKSETDTAFAHRDTLANMMMIGVWPNHENTPENIATVRANWEMVKEHTSGFYVNLNEADDRTTHGNYGANYQRLVAIKKQYDPGNLFRLNANIEPAS